MSTVCPDCQKKCKGENGLSRHRPSCPKRDATQPKGKRPPVLARIFSKIKSSLAHQDSENAAAGSSNAPGARTAEAAELDSLDAPLNEGEGDHAIADPEPPRRQRRLPARLRDFVPNTGGNERLIFPLPPRASDQNQQAPSSPPINNHDSNMPGIASQSASSHPPTSPMISQPPSLTHTWHTKPDETGRYRVYPCRPSFIPDAVNVQARDTDSAPSCEKELEVSSSDSLPLEEDTSRHLPVDPHDLRQSAHAPPDPNSRRTAKRRRHAMRALSAALGPIPNLTTLLFAKLRYLSRHTEFGDGSMADVLKLHQDPDFQASDVPTPNDFDKLKEKLKDYEPPLPGLEAGEGWQSVTVDISVPMGKQPGSQIGSTTKFSVPHLHHRSITELIQKIIRTNPDAKDFHLYPFEEYVTRNDATERLFGELYTSDAFLDEFRKVRAEPPEPDCNLEKIVLGLQFWSDATLLANFGTHKLWPVYMYIGNQSKYVRAKPTSDGGWDVAYIPELPDDIEEVLQQLPTKSAHQPLLTHCRRELFQNVLLQLLDEDFYNAYKHGMVIEFPDGIKRRVFPRILTWSADYPEKCLLATIRENGRCPCPRCFIKKSEIRNLGTKRDQRMRLQRRRKDNSWRRVMIESVRRNLYIFGKAIAGQFVNKRLDEFSMTPNENALSQRLQEFGLDYHEILPVDLLHEIEIGEWKRLLLHFIRMLYSREPGDVWVEQMNARFRAIPIFGKDTIRRLPQNVAGMKRLAARDYEDILQVSITVFEDLFGTEHSEAITKLIYVMAEWHCLAKLRLHSDSTLKHLDTVTTVLGKELRNFADKIAPSFNTKETVSETTARARQREKNQKTLFGQVLASSAARVKKYTLDRYKLHALGDYTSTIRRLGTTDSYSTYIGEARHRIKKQDYRKTNKRKFKLQMMATSVIQENLQIISHEVEECQSRYPDVFSRATPRSRETESRHPAISQIDASAIGGHRPGHTDGTNNEPLVPHLRYDISKRADSTFHIGSFVQASATDRAVKHFKSQLSDHVLCRLRGIPYSGNSLELPQDCSALRIQNNHIHCHPTMRLNYTTYDVRRATDHVKPYLKFNRKAPHCQRSETRDRSTVMLSTSDNQQSSSGFLYARVLGIFHVLASEVGRTTQEIKRIDLLWVKWFSDVPGWKGGWETRRLDRVWFPPDSEDMGNYGFVDPADVVRACHLPPVFSCGEDAERQQSIASDEGGDYKFYDVNRFVDRDMYMRYFGGGVGHVDRNQVARTLVDTADNHNGNLDEDEDDEDEDFEDQIDFERLDAILEGVDDEEGEVEDDGEEDEEDSEPDCDREEEEEEDEDDDENIDNDYED